MIKKYIGFSIGTWGYAVVSFFTTPIISWLIVPEEFGKASIYSVTLSLMFVIVNLGSTSGVVRYYYQHRDVQSKRNLLYSSLFVPFLLASIASFVLIMLRYKVSLFIFGDTNQSTGVFLLAITLILNVFSSYSLLILRLEQHSFLYSLAQISANIVNIAVIILYALFIQRNFYAIIYGLLLNKIVSITFTLFKFKFRQFWIGSFSISKDTIRKVLSYGIPLVPAGLIYLLFSSMDRLMIRAYSSFEDIGVYAAAYKIANVINIIQGGFSAFWTPLAFERYEKNPKDTSFFSRMFNVVSSGIFLLFATALIGKDVIIYLFSKSYYEAVKIAPFLFFVYIMGIASAVTSVGIGFSNKTFYHTIAVAISAVVNFIGNWYLIRFFGAKGAAISTGISYIIFFLLRTYFAEKLYPVKYRFKPFFILLLTSLSAAFISTFFGGIITDLVFFLMILTLDYAFYRSEMKEVLISTIRVVKTIVKRR